MKPALLHGRGGLGDAVWMRPFVRQAAKQWSVYVDTSWPELYADLPARVVRRMGGLRLQRHHGDKHPAETWAKLPTARPINLRYRWSQLNKRSMLAEMEVLSCIRPTPLTLDLPPLPESPVSGRYAVIRPPAVRLDYPGPAREPLPEYMQHAAETLRLQDLQVISLGSFVPGLEEPAGPPIPADLRFEHGELSLLQALALVAGAKVVVTSPGWMIPVGLAAGVPVRVIAGGCGGRNNPDAIVDRRISSQVTWFLPDEYCRCRNRLHDCPKTITNFADRFAAALNVQAVAA